MSRTPVRKYTDRKELKQATRDECIRRVKGWGGNPTREALTALISAVKALCTTSSTGRRQIDGEALYRELDAIRAKIEGYVAQDVSEPDHVVAPAARHMRLVLRGLPARPPWHEAVLAGEGYKEAPSKREAVAFLYDNERPSWWRTGEGKPSATQLAVISILAGNWPDANVHTPVGVIKAEMRALEHQRRKHRVLPAQDIELLRANWPTALKSKTAGHALRALRAKRAQ